MKNSTFWAIFIIVLVLGVTLGIAYTTSTITGAAIFDIFKVKKPTTTTPTTTTPTTPVQPTGPWHGPTGCYCIGHGTCMTTGYGCINLDCDGHCILGDYHMWGNFLPSDAKVLLTSKSPSQISAVYQEPDGRVYGITASCNCVGNGACGITGSGGFNCIKHTCNADCITIVHIYSISRANDTPLYGRVEGNKYIIGSKDLVTIQGNVLTVIDKETGVNQGNWNCECFSGAGYCKWVGHNCMPYSGCTGCQISGASAMR